MRLVRILESSALALAILAIVLFLLGAGLSAAVSLSWERHGLAADAVDEEWAWIDGQPIHYRIAGPEGAPVVVLVHGHYVEGMVVWQETLQDLPKSGLRVLSVDLIGYGRSVRDSEADYTLVGQARTVAQLLNEMRVTQATVVGHDWGAAVALQLAQDQPQFVSRLVLLAPVSRHPATGWSRWSQVPLLGRGVIWAVDGNGPYWLARRRAEFADAGVADAYLDSLDLYSRIEGTVDCLGSMASVAPEQTLPTASLPDGLPVLVVRGSEDTLTGEALVESLATRPATSVTTVEGAAHYPQLTRAGEVARLIASFALGQ